jgi:hypothetical protein
MTQKRAMAGDNAECGADRPEEGDMGVWEDVPGGGVGGEGGRARLPVQPAAIEVSMAQRERGARGARPAAPVESSPGRCSQGSPIALTQSAAPAVHRPR